MRSLVFWFGPLLLVSTVLPTPSVGATTPVPFDQEHWELQNAEITEHLGRVSLRGSALLKDVDLENGIIEVEIAVDGQRSYPGLYFRHQSRAEKEYFYLRPHQSGKADALQYAPVFNGSTEWQLYHGPGFNAAVEIPVDTWLPLRLEINGRQARVFFNDLDRPALTIFDLKRDPVAGKLVLFGTGDERVHWSNFRYEIRDDLVFEPAAPVESPAGLITDWEISQAFKVSQVDRELHPERQRLPELQWRRAACEPDGLVDLGRLQARGGREPDVLLARTSVSVTEAGRRKLEFGYSDQISIFLNGQVLFRGDSSYQSRAPGFLGLIGWWDSVFLDLGPGENELLLMVSETFGGWGFKARLSPIDGRAVTLRENISEAWASGPVFGAPESVVLDPDRQVLYVSNYYAGPVGGQEFISKIEKSGEIIAFQWITGLNRPTGLCCHAGKLYAVDRENLIEIDLETEEVVARYPLPEPLFPNDLAIDSAGRIYISDTERHVIYRLADSKVEVWLDSPWLARPNGLVIHQNRLHIGNSGDGTVRAVDLDDRSIEILAHLGAGSVVDGMVSCSEGGGYLLVSDYNGRLFRIGPGGVKEEWINSMGANWNLADFAYLPENRMLVVPTLFGGQIRAYTVGR